MACPYETPACLRHPGNLVLQAPIGDAVLVPLLRDPSVEIWKKCVPRPFDGLRVVALAPISSIFHPESKQVPDQWQRLRPPRTPRLAPRLSSSDVHVQFVELFRSEDFRSGAECKEGVTCFGFLDGEDDVPFGVENTLGAPAVPHPACRHVRGR